MRVVVTGSTGLIGTPLVAGLRADGHEVVRLVRRPPSAGDEAQWDPQGGSVDTGALRGADAVVHLAGAGIGDKRWTDEYTQLVRDSRVLGTRTLAEALAGLDDGPRVLVSGSAVGWYGDTGERKVDETDPAGEGFLADVCQEWEAAADPARDAGLRVVHPRTGLVLSRHGGLGQQVLPLFRLGLGGPLAGGDQYMPLISLPDEVAALRHCLESEELAGPVNLCMPEPVTNADFTRALGRAVHRPAVLPVPRLALRVVVGRFADEGALASQRVVPDVLPASGFTWQHPTIDDICGAVVAGA